MFKLTQSPTYWWPVRFTAPSAETTGAHVEQGFEVQFKRLNVEEHKALLVDVASTQLDDVAFARRVVTSFRRVLDERDVEIPFTPENFDRLLLVPRVASAVAQAYFSSREQAAEKNSLGPREPSLLAAQTPTTAH